MGGDNLGLKDAKKKPMLNDVIKFMQRIIRACSDTSFGGEILDEKYHKTFKIAEKFQSEQKLKLLCTTSMEPENQMVGDCEDSGVNSQIYLSSTVNRTPQGHQSGPTCPYRPGPVQPRPNTSSPACRQLGWTCVCCGGDHALFGCEDFRSRSVHDRVQIVKIHNLCANCFHPHHSRRCWHLAFSCNKYQKRHHTLLCDPTVDIDEILRSKPNHLDGQPQPVYIATTADLPSQLPASNNCSTTQQVITVTIARGDASYSGRGSAGTEALDESKCSAGHWL